MQRGHQLADGRALWRAFSGLVINILDPNIAPARTCFRQITGTISVEIVSVAVASERYRRTFWRHRIRPPRKKSYPFGAWLFSAYLLVLMRARGPSGIPGVRSAVMFAAQARSALLRMSFDAFPGMGMSW